MAVAVAEGRKAVWETVKLGKSEKSTLFIGFIKCHFGNYVNAGPGGR